MSAIRNWKDRETTDFILIHSTGHDDDEGTYEIRRQHLARGYLDIGYHFVVRRSGVIETGRIQSAPAGFPPKDSVAICLVGSEELTTEQGIALRGLIAELMLEYPNATILSKCQFTNFEFKENTNVSTNDSNDSNQ